MDALKRMGLTDYEEQIYVYLAKKGPHSQKEIAIANLNLTLKQLSDIILNLKHKGFVKSEISAVEVYSAVPLQEILESFFNKKMQEAKKLEQNRNKFLIK